MERGVIKSLKRVAISARGAAARGGERRRARLVEGRVFGCKCNNSKVEGSGREILALEPAAGGRAAWQREPAAVAGCPLQLLADWAGDAGGGGGLSRHNGRLGDSLALYKGLIGPSLGRAK